MLFWQPPSCFSKWSPPSFHVDDVSYSCVGQVVMAEKIGLSHDHRAVQLLMPSPDSRAYKRIGLGVRDVDSVMCDCIREGTFARSTQKPAMRQHL